VSLLDHSVGGEYALAFSAWGEGILGEGGLTQYMRPETAFAEYEEQFGRFPKDISLNLQDSSAFGYCICGIETALLEKMTTLKELILPDAVTHIDVTPALATIFKENNTLIRGNFDSYAEHFAAKNGLPFRPADYVFARYTYESVQETTTMSLVFRRDGSVLIKEDISSPGSSAGNTFGGSFTYPLRKDFYREQTAEEIATQFRAVIYDATVESGKLAAFMKKAKAHGYYDGPN